jgi:hypothetical protein
MSETETTAEPKTPQSEWARKRAAGRARRAGLVERRETYFDLLMSGYSVPQIARAMGKSVTAVRRAVTQALGQRRLGGHEDYARLQVARLNKALLFADRGMEEGELKAIPHFVKIVGELDRYHGLGRPVRRRGAGAPETAGGLISPPPLALTHEPAAAALAADPNTGLVRRSRRSPDCDPGRRLEGRCVSGKRPSRRAASGAAPQDEVERSSLAVTKCAKEVASL